MSLNSQLVWSGVVHSMIKAFVVWPSPSRATITAQSHSSKGGQSLTIVTLTPAALLSLSASAAQLNRKILLLLLLLHLLTVAQ